MSSLHERSIEVKAYSYEWTIDDFNSSSTIELLSNGQIESCTTSPSFPEVPGSANIPKWCIRAFALNSKYPDHLSLEVVLLGPLNAYAKFKMSILNNKGGKLAVVNSETLLYTTFSNTKRFDKVISLNSLMCTANGFWTKNKLTILCEVSVAFESVVRESVQFFVPTKNLPFKEPKHTLGDNLEILFDSEQGSDITLAAGDREFKAHINIVTARSKVFAAMFEHDTEEKKLSRVAIPDIDPVVLEAMLRYMYTDKVSNLNTMADHLLAAADKYALENLKVMCEETLWTNITIEKAANTLMLADRHSAEQLKERTNDFIFNNYSAVVGTQGWKDIIISDVNLVAQILSASQSYWTKL